MSSYVSIGKVTEIQGLATATDKSGEVRTLHLHDDLNIGDTIYTQEDSVLTILYTNGNIRTLRGKKIYLLDYHLRGSQSRTQAQGIYSQTSKDERFSDGGELYFVASSANILTAVAPSAGALYAALLMYGTITAQKYHPVTQNLDDTHAHNALDINGIGSENTANNFFTPPVEGATRNIEADRNVVQGDISSAPAAHNAAPVAAATTSIDTSVNYPAPPPVETLVVVTPEATPPAPTTPTTPPSSTVEVLFSPLLAACLKAPALNMALTSRPAIPPMLLKALRSRRHLAIW